MADSNRALTLADASATDLEPAAMQQWVSVPGDQHVVRILVIQLWTVDPEPIEVAVRAAGIDASFARADFEAALNAALAHDRFDLAIFDPTTPGLTREIIESCFKVSGRNVPLIVFDHATLRADVLRVLGPRRN
jgi:tRNA/tmRNA/rRNA uracil-C5-methylase (TrmA/RlmC/RlmD family)